MNSPTLSRLPALLALVAASLLGCMDVHAQRCNTLAPLPRTRQQKCITDQPPSPAPFDTVATATLSPAPLQFSGYDKTLRANRETLFITNGSQTLHVGGVFFTIEYLDTQGRQLHRRKVRQHVDLPPGQTRRIDFPSWDRQCSFYYRGSTRPRTSAIPYTVRLRPDTLLIHPNPLQ